MKSMPENSPFSDIELLAELSSRNLTANRLLASVTFEQLPDRLIELACKLARENADLSQQLQQADLRPLLKWHEMSDGAWLIEGLKHKLLVTQAEEGSPFGDWVAFAIAIDEKNEISDSDWWPRCYFGLDVAKAQCEAWLLKRQTFD